MKSGFRIWNVKMNFWVDIFQIVSGHMVHVGILKVPTVQACIGAAEMITHTTSQFAFCIQKGMFF